MDWKTDWLDNKRTHDYGVVMMMMMTMMKVMILWHNNSDKINTTNNSDFDSHDDVFTIFLLSGQWRFQVATCPDNWQSTLYGQTSFKRPKSKDGSNTKVKGEVPT